MFLLGGARHAARPTSGLVKRGRLAHLAARVRAVAHDLPPGLGVGVVELVRGDAHDGSVLLVQLDDLEGDHALDGLEVVGEARRAP